MKLTAIFVAVSMAIGSTAAFAQRAGELISAEPVVETPGGVQAWKIAYTSSH